MANKAKTKANKDIGLNAKLLNDQVVITIGIDVLAYAIQNGDEWPEGFKIKNKRKFAEEVVDILNQDEEDGDTSLHRVLDNAALAVLESGSENISEQGEDE